MSDHEHKAQWHSVDRANSCRVQRCRCGATRRKAFEGRGWTEWQEG